MTMVQSGKIRWARLAARVLLLLIGALQSLLCVIVAVGLIFSVATDFGEGPASVADGVVLLIVDLALFSIGLLTLISALEDWDPPYNRWQGIRWNVLGGAGVVVTLISWAIVATFGWLG